MSEKKVIYELWRNYYDRTGGRKGKQISKALKFKLKLKESCDKLKHVAWDGLKMPPYAYYNRHSSPLPTVP